MFRPGHTGRGGAENAAPAVRAAVAAALPGAAVVAAVVAGVVTPVADAVGSLADAGGPERAARVATPATASARVTPAALTSSDRERCGPERWTPEGCRPDRWAPGWDGVVRAGAASRLRRRSSRSSCSSAALTSCDA